VTGVQTCALPIYSNGHVLHDCGTGDLVQIRHTDEIVEIVLAGGAGYGDPRQRPREAVEQDVRMGLVTRAGALRDYGVDLDHHVVSDAASAREQVLTA
jgi:5-oxoprolinase (ATP-hydrolysing)